MQRLRYKKLKKEYAEEVSKNSDRIEESKNRLDEFYKKVQDEELNYKVQNIPIASPDREKNIYDNYGGNKIILFNEQDKNALRIHHELIFKTRPEMIKEQSSNIPHDFDFEIDVTNYDPWQEYKMIYRDVLRKGRAYFILQSIPEWRFLQVGRPSGHEDDSMSHYNYKRMNNRDSIFSLITNERYFDERIKKEGSYKAYSQAIRI